MSIPVENTPLSFFVQKLERGEPFTFSRFGDGEWRCVFGKDGRNCDKHQYFSGLRNDLIKALCTQHDVIFGMQNLALRIMGDKIETFLKKKGIKRRWHNADVLHRANLQGKLYPLIRALNTRQVCIVGPSHVKHAGLPCSLFVEVPTLDCYRTTKQVIKTLVKSRNRYDTILFSSSMATEAWMEMLYPQLGSDTTMIDCGSIWDPYCGVKSRTAFKKGDWRLLQEQNFRGVPVAHTARK